MHSYLFSDVGAKGVFIMSAAGEIEWEYPADQYTDAWLLDNGNVLMSFTGDKRGAREVTPDKSTRFCFVLLFCFWIHTGIIVSKMIESSEFWRPAKWCSQ